MNFSNEQLNNIIDSMYLDVPPSELTLDWFKSKLHEAIKENDELLNDPVKKQEYEIIKAIINSNEFKALEDKTQVINRIICGENVSTRMTHTFQVFWITFRTAQALGLDPLKAGIIALSHDLGHVVFGHSGEREINRIIQLIKSRTGLVMLNTREYDYGFYDKIDEFKHEKYSAVLFEKILNDNNLDIDKQLKEEIIDGIFMHGGKFGKAKTLEGKIISAADKIYLHQDCIDMFMLHKSIEANIARDLKDGYKISSEVKKGAALIKSVLNNIPKQLGNTPQQRKDNMLKSLLLNSNEKTFAFDQETLNNIETLKTYLYENLYSNKYIKEIEENMNLNIFLAYNKILEEAEDVKDEVEGYFRINGYFNDINIYNVDFKKLYGYNLDLSNRIDLQKFIQRCNSIESYVKMRAEKRFNKLLFCFLNSNKEGLKNTKRNLQAKQYIDEMKQQYGNYLEPNKVFNLIVGLTDKKIICHDPYTLKSIRFLANENPLIDRNIIEKNITFSDPDFSTREYFDCFIDNDTFIPVDELPKLGLDLRIF